MNPHLMRSKTETTSLQQNTLGHIMLRVRQVGRVYGLWMINVLDGSREDAIFQRGWVNNRQSGEKYRERSALADTLSNAVGNLVAATATGGALPRPAAGITIFMDARVIPIRQG